MLSVGRSGIFLQFSDSTAPISVANMNHLAANFLPYVSAIPTANRRHSSELALIVVFSTAALLVHLLTNGRYGYFRDELYYLACARHLDFGYVDQPPLSILLLRLSEALLAIRCSPFVSCRLWRARRQLRSQVCSRGS